MAEADPDEKRAGEKTAKPAAGPESAQDEGGGSEPQVPKVSSGPGADAKPKDDPDAELKFADHEPATYAELREALDWAFAEENVPSELLDGYAKHALMVLEGNRRMNLTSIVEPREMAAKHYLDCWRVTKLLPLIGKTVLDLGSGAGFPGIPIAMAEPNTRVVCLDSTKKRVDFIEECIEALDVKNASTIWERGEEYLLRNKVNMVVMRAISSVRENVRLLRKVRHSLKDLVMLKGPSWSRETRAGEREVERLGFRLDTVWDHELPGDLGVRAILVYRAPGGMGE